MLKKILCIACAENRMTLCQFAINWRGAQLLHHHNTLVHGYNDPQHLAKTIVTIVDRHDLQSDQYRLSLPTHVTILRNWNFPFNSPQKISQALEFELEQEIPFSLEEVITDIHFGTKTPQNRNVISASIHKNFLGTLITELQTHDIDPQQVTIHAFALAKAAGKICSKTPTLLAHVDTESTQLICLENNIPYTVSQIPYGMHHIKKALQLQLNATPDTVERFIYFSNIATGDNTDQENEKKIKEALSTQLQRLAKQILLSLNSENQAAESLLLYGDIARLQGVEKFFTDEVGLPTIALHKHPNASNLLPVKDNDEWLECLPAYALAPIKNSAFQQTKNINFRKDEFSFTPKKDPLTKRITYATTLASILMLMFSLSFFAQGYKKSEQIETVNAELKSMLQKILPDVNRSFGTIQYTSILKSRLSQLHGNINQNDPKTNIDSLDLLLALHKSTPKSLDIAIECIRITEKNIGLVGTTNSFNTLETFRSLLAKNTYFKTVGIRGATNQKKQKRIRFELEVRKAG